MTQLCLLGLSGSLRRASNSTAVVAHAINTCLTGFIVCQRHLTQANLGGVHTRG